MSRPAQKEFASEDRVDEAVSESFPASDSPGWSPTHAGPPQSRSWPVGRRQVQEAREQILVDLERLGRRFDLDARSEAREDLMARTILDAGRPVELEPIDGAGGVRNVEAQATGTAEDLPCVVLGARYDVDDVTRGAMLVAVIRALIDSKLLRTVRFVAFANAGSHSGALRYAARLRREAVSCHAMVSLSDIGLPRGGNGGVTFAFSWRSWPVASIAREAFRYASPGLRSRMVALPTWWPSLRTSDHGALARSGWPALMVTDSLPGWPKAESTESSLSGWRPRPYPNVDSMASAALGIAAAVKDLARMPSASDR